MTNLVSLLVYSLLNKTFQLLRVTSQLFLCFRVMRTGKLLDEFFLGVNPGIPVDHSCRNMDEVELGHLKLKPY